MISFLAGDLLSSHSGERVLHRTGKRPEISTADLVVQAQTACRGACVHADAASEFLKQMLESRVLGFLREELLGRGFLVSVTASDTILYTQTVHQLLMQFLSSDLVVRWGPSTSFDGSFMPTSLSGIFQARSRCKVLFGHFPIVRSSPLCC